LIAILIVLLFGAMIAYGPYLDWSTATEGESAAVTGVVPVRRGRDLYFVVSGHSSRTSEESSGNNRRHTVVTDYPRLTSRSGRDGHELAMRQYAPIIRFEYVDTSIHALLAESGRVWVVSSERAVGLHAVDPVSLADVVPTTALRARIPLLAAGLFIEPGMNARPVVARGTELFLRLNSGEMLALDPKASSVRELGQLGEHEDDVDDAAGPEPEGNRVVDALVRGRRHTLEPRVAPVFDVDGAPDAAAAYVITQTSLDRNAARVTVTRWDTSTETPTEGWHTTISEIAPDCCSLRAWRYDGLVVLWYEKWLIALDDTTGARRWVQRL